MTQNFPNFPTLFLSSISPKAVLNSDSYSQNNLNSTVYANLGYNGDSDFFLPHKLFFKGFVSTVYLYIPSFPQIVLSKDTYMQ